MALPEHTYVTVEEVAEHFRRSVKSIKRWSESRGFPRPILAEGGGPSLYVTEEVKNWEAQLLSKRSECQAA